MQKMKYHLAVRHLSDKSDCSMARRPSCNLNDSIDIKTNLGVTSISSPGNIAGNGYVYEEEKYLFDSAHLESI